MVQRTAQPGVTQTFRDGRVVLKGFVLSDKPVSEDRWYLCFMYLLNYAHVTLQVRPA